MSNELAVVPAMELPAHLRTPEAVAEIAAANAAAGGGIKAGSFPSISIKANKFHIKENGELKTFMLPAVDGQPAVPLMCLNVVVVAANPNLNKVFFASDYVEGEVKEPDCRSSNGVTPDADVAIKQNAVCATCKQNQWGSKVSKISGKDIKACDDGKQLAVLPPDLTGTALGLAIHKGSLANWGKYVAALSGRGYPITGLVTSITFDATANGVLNFAFNRFLTPEESAKVKERAAGQDVQVIVAQTRAAVPALAVTGGVTITEPPNAATAAVSPAPVALPVTATAGFGATTVVTPPVQPAEAPANTRKRRTREQIEADKAKEVAQGSHDPALAHLPEPVLAAVLAVGKDSPGGKAMLAAYPAPVVMVKPVDPYEGQPEHVKIAVEATGGVSTAAGAATYKALTGKDVPGSTVAASVSTQTVTAAPAAGAVNPAPSAQVTASAASLKDKLAKLLGSGKPA